MNINQTKANKCERCPFTLRGRDSWFWFEKQQLLRDNVMQAALILELWAAGKLFWINWSQIMQDLCSWFRFTIAIGHFRAQVSLQNNCRIRIFEIFMDLSLGFSMDRFNSWMFYTTLLHNLDDRHCCQRFPEES